MTGIPYAAVHIADDGTITRTCPLCDTTVTETADTTGELTSNNYAEHYARDHVESVTLTYDPTYVDPNESDGSYVWVGIISARYPDGDFDFVPANGQHGWTVCHQEIEDGLVAVDPKQVS